MKAEKFPQHESLVGIVDPATLEEERRLFNVIMAPKLTRLIKILEILREAYEESSYPIVCAHVGTADPELAEYLRQRKATRQEQA